MIRAFKEKDLPAVMQIWLDSNLKTHHFIPKEYWTAHYAAVKEMLPRADVYVHEDDNTRQVTGFIGLTNDYIAGIFVKGEAQSRGIGKRLLDYVKKLRPALSLSVYQKNVRAVSFYQREQFSIHSENMDGDTNEKELIMNWKRDSPVNR